MSASTAVQSRQQHVECSSPKTVGVLRYSAFERSTCLSVWRPSSSIFSIFAHRASSSTQVLRFPSNHSFIVDFPLVHVLLNLLCLPLASSLVVLCLDIHIFPDCSFVHPIIPCVCSLYGLSIQSGLPVPLYWVDYYIRHRSFFIWTSSLLTPSPTLKLFKNHPSTFLLSTLLPTCSYNHRAACVTLFLSGHYIVAAQPRSSVTMYEHVPFALITVAS